MTAPTWDATADPKPPFLRIALAWLYYKREADIAVARANKAREVVAQQVRDSPDAYLDGRGHVFLDLPEQLTVGDTTYAAIKREKRVTRSVDQDRAWDLAKARGVFERLFPLKPTFDEQELYVLYEEGLITEQEIDRLFDVKETWALKPVAA